MYEYFILVCGQIIFHSVAVSPFVYSSVEHFELLPLQHYERSFQARSIHVQVFKHMHSILGYIQVLCPFLNWIVFTADF